MPDLARCRGCGQTIGWVTMDSGKKMPVDLDEQKLVVEELGFGHIVTGYRPHWATCPKADQFKPARKVAS